MSEWKYVGVDRNHELILVRTKEQLLYLDAECLVELYMRARNGDYVDVVRCKDCKWYVPFRNIRGEELDEGECEGYDPCVPANHFCSRGERREEII